MNAQDRTISMSPYNQHVAGRTQFLRTTLFIAALLFSAKKICSSLSRPERRVATLLRGYGHSQMQASKLYRRSRFITTWSVVGHGLPVEKWTKA